MLHGLANTAHLLVKILHKLFELHSAGVTGNVVGEVTEAANQLQKVVDDHHDRVVVGQTEAPLEMSEIQKGLGTSYKDIANMPQAKSVKEASE